MVRKVIWSPSAREDLKSIVLFIAQDNPLVAVKFGKALLQRSRQIEIQGFSGRVVPEFEDPNIREIIHRPYRLIYRIKEDSIEVIRVWHAARNDLTI